MGGGVEEKGKRMRLGEGGRAEGERREEEKIGGERRIEGTEKRKRVK